jgi:hypothetical protein
VKMMAMVAAVANGIKKYCRDDVGGSTINNDLPVQTIVVNEQRQ